MPSILTLTGVIVSLGLLSIAARTLPIATAYAVWVGIGAAGAVVLELTLLGEPATPARVAFLALLIFAIVGLKVTSS